VPFQDCYAFVRTLGVNVNLVGTWGQEVQEISHKLARIANIVRAKRAASYIKVKAIRMAVQEGVLYQAAGLAWLLADIQTINNRISQMIRRALKLAPSYPYALPRTKPQVLLTAAPRTY
jgi:hypothetical protein